MSALSSSLGALVSDFRDPRRASASDLAGPSLPALLPVGLSRLTLSSRPVRVGLCSVSMLACVRCWSLLVCSAPPVFLFEEFQKSTEVSCSKRKVRRHSFHIWNEGPHSFHIWNECPPRACPYTDLEEDEEAEQPGPSTSPWAGRTRGTGLNAGMHMTSPGGVYDLPPRSPIGVSYYFDRNGDGKVSPQY